MKTLIFDLDETLVHCKDQLDGDTDITIDIEFSKGDVV